MATYMQRVLRSSAPNFSRLGQIRLFGKQLNLHQQVPALSPVSELQLTRTYSRPSAVEPSSNDAEITNPLSYPGELEEGDGLTTYFGDLQEGEERPHMLHAVWRIRSYRGKPWWDRDTIEALGLEKRDKIVIHKNTPAVNELLTQVRHLVRIKPVILKYGLPNGDYENTLLKQNGEFIVKRKVEGLRVISEEDEDLLKEAQKADAARTDST